MKIIHFSDPHGGGPAEDWQAYFDKRWVGVFNYRFRRRFRHDLKQLESAVAYILSARPDLAVCTGDLTSAGQPGEFERVLQVLKPLRDSAIPLLYLPGNHDCYVPRRHCVEAMHHAVEYLSRGDYRFDDLPLLRRYGGVDFLLVNTSAPSNLLCSWGFMGRKNCDFLTSACADAGSTRVLLSHYPMFERHPLLRTRHRLFGQRPAVQLLRSGRISLSLCGHVHRPYLWRDETTGRVLESCAGSVTRNGSMVEVELVPGGEAQFRTILLP